MDSFTPRVNSNLIKRTKQLRKTKGGCEEGKLLYKFRKKTDEN